MEALGFAFSFIYIFIYQIPMTMKTSRFTESLVVMPSKTATVRKRSLLVRPVSTQQKHRSHLIQVEKRPKRSRGKQLRRARHLDQPIVTTANLSG